MLKKLVLENGTEFIGQGFGADKEVFSEIVFNTSMVGYQEIASDPSYFGQTVVMTYPLIGNYGFNEEDYESRFCSLSGLVVKEANDIPSNYRHTKTLHEVLEEQGIPGISGIDTRKLTRIIREEGSMKCAFTEVDKHTSEVLEQLKAYDIPNNQVEQVSCKTVWHSKTRNHEYRVVFIDCGTKLNIVRKLNEKGCNVIVVPYNTSAEQIAEYNPDGIFISNGPGNPEDVVEVIELVKTFQGKVPMFGICLGHQMIALANNAETYKLKFGHRGGNHPVKNLNNHKVEITSQNHSYAVKEESINQKKIEITHINLLDQTVEGINVINQQCFSVQYHPESAPGPEDSEYLFDQFIQLMEGSKKNA